MFVTKEAYDTTNLRSVLQVMLMCGPYSECPESHKSHHHQHPVFYSEDIVRTSNALSINQVGSGELGWIDRKI